MVVHKLREVFDYLNVEALFQNCMIHLNLKPNLNAQRLFQISYNILSKLWNIMMHYDAYVKLNALLSWLHRAVFSCTLHFDWNNISTQ